MALGQMASIERKGNKNKREGEREREMDLTGLHLPLAHFQSLLLPEKLLVVGLHVLHFLEAYKHCCVHIFIHFFGRTQKKVMFWLKARMTGEFFYNAK